MGRPKDMSPAETFKHGTRARYVAGCRCRPCTHANTQERNRKLAEASEAARALGPRTETHCIGAGDEPCPWNRKLYKNSAGNYCAKCKLKLTWNGLVPAKKARQHLKKLSKQGVGYKAVADATDLPYSTLALIRNEGREQIRAETERLILDTDTSIAADGAYVDAERTWRQINRLMKVHGYSRARIAKEMGNKSRALQLGKKRVTVKNAAKINRLYRQAEGLDIQR